MTQLETAAPSKRGFWTSLGLDSRERVSWALYDWANSAFATTILAAVFPIFYASYAYGSAGDSNAATVAFAYTSSAALLIAAVAGPILGSIADSAAARKGLLGFFTALGVFFTASFWFIGEGQWALASGLFVLANLGFNASNIFYDSLLPHITDRFNIDRLSSSGYALGYLGGGILLVINALWLTSPATFGFADTTAAARFSLVSVAVWWAVFSLPIFLFVQEPRATNKMTGKPVVAGFRQLGQTFRKLRRYRQAIIFLVAFWLYGDGINTIIRMATIYGTEVGIGQTQLILALVMTQFVGFPFSFAFGPLAQRIGQKGALYLALSVYTVISIGGFFLSEAWHFWVLAFGVAMVQGGSQAISRSLFSTLIPRSQSSEFFGFFTVSSKFAGMLGPLIFAVVSQVMGSSRLSIVSLLVFFVGGMLILTRVNVEEGRRIAREEDSQAGVNLAS